MFYEQHINEQFEVLLFKISFYLYWLGCYTSFFDYRMMKELQINKGISIIIKGFSCLLILTHHYCQCMDGKGFDNFFVHLIGMRGGVIGVTFFFFLSAWGLSESQKKNKYPFITFAKRRLSKVYIPLVLTNLIYYLFLLCLNQISFNLTFFLLMLFNLKMLDGVLWFCNVIIIFYLIFYIAFLFQSKLGKIIFCVVATILYSVVVTTLYPDSPFYVYSIIGFPFGLLLSLYKESVMNFYYWVLWCLVFIVPLLLCAVLFPIFSKLFFMNIISFVIISILICFVFILRRADFSYTIYMILSFVGIYSYEIYLLHYKVLLFVAELDMLIWYPLSLLILIIPLSVILHKVSKNLA